MKRPTDEEHTLPVEEYIRERARRKADSERLDFVLAYVNRRKLDAAMREEKVLK